MVLSLSRATFLICFDTVIPFLVGSISSSGRQEIPRSW